MRDHDYVMHDPSPHAPGAILISIVRQPSFAMDYDAPRLGELFARHLSKLRRVLQRRRLLPLVRILQLCILLVD